MVSTYDPFQVEQPETTFKRLKELRAEGPVVPIGEGMYYVTSFEEARKVLRDVEHFSSAEGFRAPGVDRPCRGPHAGRAGRPQHPGVRRIVMSAFNPAAIRLEEEFVRQRAHALLDALDVPGTVDMVPAFTTQLPNDATVHLLGFPMEDAPRIAAWSKEVMESEWPAMNRTERGEGMEGAFPEYTAYVDAFVASLREAVAAGHAPEGLLTRLLTADVGGEQLSERQMRALVFNLLLGGLTTTAQLLGNVIFQLLVSDSVSQLAGGRCGRTIGLHRGVPARLSAGHAHSAGVRPGNHRGGDHGETGGAGHRRIGLRQSRRSALRVERSVRRWAARMWIAT